jgi:RNA recognition motif-containing protein
VIIKDQRTGESRGFAFVEFREREACLHAIKHLNGIEFQGQKLSVVLAKPSQSTEKKATTHRGSTSSSCMNDRFSSFLFDISSHELVFFIF